MSDRLGRARRAAGVLVAAAAAVAATSSAGAAVTVEWVSVDSSGGAPDGPSFGMSLSTTGQYVAFHSHASDVVPGDGNGVPDVFVRDVRADRTTRVSVDIRGGDPDGYSLGPAISASGRYVAFTSVAGDLVRGDDNGLADVFVRDLVERTTTRVSVDRGGGDANGPVAGYPRISGDGRFVAFSSAASDLVAGDGNGTRDVYVRDLAERTTTRVSVDLSGGDPDGPSDSPDISASGRYVAFDSAASDLVPGDDGGDGDVFLRDLPAATTTRVSVDASGDDANRSSGRPAVSADGRFVAFDSTATDLAGGEDDRYFDVFLRDLATETTTRVSVDLAGGSGDGNSMYAAISDDGHRVAFRSTAADLTAGDDDPHMDIFVRDVRARRTGQVTTGGEGWSEEGDISGDGRAVVFSFTGKLAQGDTNRVYDAYVRWLR